MKSFKIIGLALIISVLFLTSCSNRVDEKTIEQDITPHISSTLSKNETIDNLEIIEHINDNEETLVSIKVTSSDDIATYINYFSATYELIDKEWVLDNVSQIDKDKSTITPHKGVNKEIIISSLLDKSININDDTWRFDSKNINNISIKNSDTDLRNKKDTVVVLIGITDEVQEETGELLLSFVFNKKWELETLSKHSEFKITEKPECILDVSDNDLISEILNNKITLFENTQYYQNISITKEEISNFEVYNKTSLNKGKTKNYYFKGVITKPTATISFDCHIFFIYEKQWLKQPLNIKTKINSVHIAENWNGIFNSAPYKGTASLKITKFTNDGTIEGIYSYTPEVINQWSQPGSYEVSGSINLSNMLIKLQAGNWVNEDSSALSITKNDISAFLDIENTRIKGSAHEGNPFRVTPVQ